MLLICNKKTKRKIDKDQLILGQNYVLHNNYSGQKQGDNFVFPSIQKKLEFILCIVSRQFGQNLDKMDSWHSLQKFTYLRNYWTESNGVFLQNAGNELHVHYRKSYFDSFKISEVIDAESPIVIFVWLYLCLSKRKLAIRARCYPCACRPCRLPVSRPASQAAQSRCGRRRRPAVTGPQG